MIRNLSDTQVCQWCRDDAQVLVGWSAVGTDEMAPCPMCERGKRLENATTTVERGRDGKERELPRRQPDPWKGGYWQGRPTEGVEPEPDPEGRPLSRAENRRRWAELMGRMAGAVKEMP